VNLFKKIFGSQPPLDRIRRALDSKCWAEALTIGQSLDRERLLPEEQEELGKLLTVAGDALAELNMAEGEACLRGGDRERAREHFTLAAAKAGDAELAHRAAQALAAAVPAAAAGGCCSSGCSTPAVPEREEDFPEQLDPQTRFDLILASYPLEMAERYEHLGDRFREAFLLAHEGREGEALPSFDQIPSDERNDLFHFERGALLARMGRIKEGCRDLERAVELAPGNPLILETAVNLELAADRVDAAEKRVRGMIETGIALPFCHGRLALIMAHRGDMEGALRHGFDALSHGAADRDTILLIASILEKAGRLAETENLLARLSGGGCGGSVNIPLAEFRLRHGENLDKALDDFKGAAREEPGNPRWPMRIAQVYLRKGWKKEGRALLEKTLADPGLDPVLREEGTILLRSS
jgi:tetratricopeptide (TPR) repeat protein